MPYIAQVAVGKLEELLVYGDDYPTPDGTGVHDYIHVADRARGHLAALEALRSRAGVLTLNLGTGRGTSVLERVRAFAAASGRGVPYRVAARRPGPGPGDIARSAVPMRRSRSPVGTGRCLMSAIGWEVPVGIVLLGY